jgi:hypothetical protein
MGQAPEPIGKNLQELAQYIKTHQNIDCALATDGDADRIGLYDSHGEFIDSHHIILLLIHYLVKYKGMSGKVAIAFSVTPRVYKMCEHYGLEHTTTKIGFKDIAAIMVKEDVLLGGEESGGIIGSYAGETGIAVTATCYSTGNIIGPNAGGIYGAYAGSGDNASVEANTCYSTGSIAGADRGGIFGANAAYNSGSITASNCYILGTGTILALPEGNGTKNVNNCYIPNGPWLDENANNNLTGTPIGGTFSVQSGDPSALVGNVFNAGDFGSWVLAYTVTNSDGCSGVNTVSFTIDCVVGLNQLSLENVLTIYPNPTTGQFKITSELNEGGELQIFNQAGQLVYKKSLENLKENNIDVKDLTPGYYNLQVNSSSKKYLGKLNVIK